LVAVAFIHLIAALHVVQHALLVAHHRVELQFVAEQYLEDLTPHLRQIILGMEGHRRLAPFGLHGRHVPKVGVRQQALPQAGQLRTQRGRVSHVQHAQHEVA
jgi:hypothetical protein